MKYKILTVRDRVADVFGTPFFVASVGAGIRSFGDEVKRVDGNNQLNKHPDDFDLYYLGEFDDSTGMFDTARPSQVAIGKDYA